MVDYGLNDRVVLITGANNPQGIGAAAAYAFAREGAKVVLVYKRLMRAFDEKKMGKMARTGILWLMPGMHMRWKAACAH